MAKKYIALAVAIVVLGGGAFLSQQWFIQTFDATTERKTHAITFAADTEGTVLNVMNALKSEDKLSFSGRDFPSLGFFVEEINGLRSTDGYYWILIINGEKSKLGASSARVQPGDVVEWRYEEGY
ncbi:hypothetical protein A3A39_04845 [Candidatus Kaiserbacteria bacterium RIFCSPLOWO2_01_FULL_54_13]|uniref:Transcobalamin-like C-terminal domain-containing protein n=1 Tax=Candidatus Kaiserbacteria bacterium RIFCSPLOWO2_01_FULL_54_13 TaxID=1798512 RepID=A0A1F6F0U3_9BACT|nr:MAG: hypothetical protein A3A39_04845 [Candidatus Kaiserbacteria bacterium RIFCSPLOWO2_01_FULL_54_13]